MSEVPKAAPEVTDLQGGIVAPLHRRNFLRFAGAGVALTGLVLAGCGDDLSEVEPQTSGSSAVVDGVVNVGSGDFGVLNYAYALEQLEAAFYAQVLQGQYYNSMAIGAERVALKDIAAHERVHRDFLKAGISALGGTPIKDLEVDFSSINFSSRASVLGAAKAFEDLGVAAYNGAGPLIKNPDILALAGKVVSVEARHAALIRDFLQNGTFVGPDVVDLTTGLEKSMRPRMVAAQANNFLMPNSTINVSQIEPAA